MKIEDIKLGMKVIPISKTPKGFINNLQDSYVWEKAKKRKQPFLYVTGINVAGFEIVLNVVSNDRGDFFSFKDVIPYYEKPVYTEQETYELLHSLMTDIKLTGAKINDDTDLKEWFNENKK